MNARHWPAYAANGLATLGGVIAIISAAYAILEVGGLPSFRDRMPLGILALIVAFAANFGGAIVLRQPKRGAIIILISSVVGIVAINLFYINTFYVVAAPFWWLAAAIAWFVVTPSRRLG